MLGTLGGPELILIVVIALIVFGPRKLPEIGKSMGKMLYEFRKASTDFQRTIQDEIESEKTRAEAPQTLAPPTPQEARPAVAGPDLQPMVVAPEVLPKVVAPEGAPAAPTVVAPEAPTVSRGAEIK